MAGGGIGEAALIGAAFGGGASALTGGDPLKGALLGGITGGAGAGISGALGGAAPAAAEGAILSNAGAGATNMLPTVAHTASLNATAVPTALPNATPSPTFFEGMQSIAKNPTQYILDNKYKLGAAGLAGALGSREEFKPPNEEYDGPLKRFRYNPDVFRPSFMAEGGIASLAAGGYDRMVGEEPMYQPMARGGISDLGSYSDGGRMLKGPGDGMSDSIPASISGKRPARLAEGEFVVPADVVSHLGNGSTDAGAKQLYAMMNKVRKDRTGRAAQGREINPRKYVPA
jgi:hypothetical protein